MTVSFLCPVSLLPKQFLFLVELYIKTRRKDVGRFSLEQGDFLILVGQPGDS